jgi:hypothetical protein
MSLSNLFNFSRLGNDALPPAGGRTEIVQIHNSLRRVLAFTGHTIDDVVNSPVAKMKVLGFYKLHRWVARENETSDLERQWNPLR